MLDAVRVPIRTVTVFLIGGKRASKERAHKVYHGIVPIIAARADVAIAVGPGSLVLHGAWPSGRPFFFARYLDRSVTTPLPLLPLAGTAVHSQLRRGNPIAGTLLADVRMIVTAFAFGASTDASVKWTGYATSCVAFSVVPCVMWGSLPAGNAAEPAPVRDASRRDAATLSVWWCVDPVILFVDPDGTGPVGSTTGVAMIAVIDLLSRPLDGLFSAAGMRRIGGAEQRGRAIAARPVPPLGQRRAA